MSTDINLKVALDDGYLLVRRGLKTLVRSFSTTRWLEP
jgi:hypothetical protein